MATLSEISTAVDALALTDTQKIGMYFLSLCYLLPKVDQPTIDSDKVEIPKELAIEIARVFSAFVRAISTIDGFEQVTSVALLPDEENDINVVNLAGQALPLGAINLPGTRLEMDLGAAKDEFVQLVLQLRSPILIFTKEILKLYLPQSA